MNAPEAIRRTIAVIRRQHKTLATEHCYVHWLRRYMAAIREMPNELPSEKKLERFLTELATLRDLSASSQNQAFNAVLFFYDAVLGVPLKHVDALRATRPVHQRHAPTREEVRQLAEAVPNWGGYPTNLIFRMLYGAGLRVTEPLNLRVKDLDFDIGRMVLRGAKGQKDRTVSIPESLIEELLGQLDWAKKVWTGDVRDKLPVKLPHQLAVKYPENEFAWAWAWVFPAHWPCPDPRSETLRRVRYRMHEANVQRAVKSARRRLGISALPHEMRHSYATHSIEDGVSLVALKEAMGHAKIETTAGYCHADSCSVPSPLDRLNRAPGNIVRLRA